MNKLILVVPLIFSGCASIQQNKNYGFFPGPGMSEDAQDFPNNKYNILDSSDGSKDPNGQFKIWKSEY